MKHIVRLTVVCVFMLHACCMHADYLQQGQIDARSVAYNYFMQGYPGGSVGDHLKDINRELLNKMFGVAYDLYMSEWGNPADFMSYMSKLERSLGLGKLGAFGKLKGDKDKQRLWSYVALVLLEWLNELDDDTYRFKESKAGRDTPIGQKINAVKQKIMRKLPGNMQTQAKDIERDVTRYIREVRNWDVRNPNNTSSFDITQLVQGLPGGP